MAGIRATPNQLKRDALFTRDGILHQFVRVVATENGGWHIQTKLVNKNNQVRHLYLPAGTVVTLHTALS